MKRWTITQALLPSTWRISPLTPVLSVPLLEHRWSSLEIYSVGQRRQVSIQLTTTPYRGRFWWSNDNSNPRAFITLRGGSERNMTDSLHHHKQDQEYTVLSAPAPGSPFHHAFPVHDLDLAKEFYGTVLGCAEGRSSTKWQDYSLHGHQIVAHWVGENYRCQDYYNPVDGDEVPVPRT